MELFSVVRFADLISNPTCDPTDKSVGYYQSSAWRTLISNPNCDPTDESVAIVIVC